MTKTKLLLAGLLTGAVALGTGCATTATRDTDPPTPASTPGIGGAGLDPNPDHNIPNAPNGIDGDPLSNPGTPAAPTNAPDPDGAVDSGESLPQR